MTTRRQALKQSLLVASLLAGAGLLPTAAQAAHNKAAFDAKNLTDVLKALGVSAPVESKEVSLTGPDIAENGAVVPLGVSTTLTGVKHLLILVEKNPNALVAMFHVTDSIEPNFSTRSKLGQSGDVLAVAVLADGKVLYTKKEVKVTLGGCGG